VNWPNRMLCALVAALNAACPGDDTDDGATDGGKDGDTGPAAWQVVLDAGDLDRAVLSVWGAGPSDVYAVGGPLGNSGFETLAVHFDGTAWRALAPGGTETFWWVSGSGPKDVWMVGTEGRIAHWDGTKFTPHDSGTTATLWGVWAASPSDAWIVGGTPEGGTSKPNDIVLHWDGSTWSPVAVPMPLGRAFFKVWGASSDDLYVVGEAGTIWHKKASTWALEANEPPLAMDRLFTVNGCNATEIYAVGSRDVLESDGATWKKLDVELTNDVNGVACNAPGEVAIVGFGGLKQRLVAGAWIDEFDVEPFTGLHAVWADGAGTFWAVGGDFVSGAAAGKPREGVVARYGKGTVADTVGK